MIVKLITMINVYYKLFNNDIIKFCNLAQFTSKFA